MPTCGCLTIDLRRAKGRIPMIPFIFDKLQMLNIFSKLSVTIPFYLFLLEIASLLSLGDEHMYFLVKNDVISAPKMFTTRNYLFFLHSDSFLIFRDDDWTILCWIMAVKMLVPSLHGSISQTKEIPLQEFRPV